MVLQQKVPPSMTHEISSTCQSPTTAGHLRDAKTSEKMKQKFSWSGLQEDKNCLSAIIRNVRNVRDRPGNIIIHWWNGRPAILFTILKLISWDPATVKWKHKYTCHWTSFDKKVQNKTIARSNSRHNCKRSI